MHWWSKRGMYVLVPSGFAIVTALIGFTLEHGTGFEQSSFRVAYLVISLLVGWLAFMLMRRQLELERTLEQRTRDLQSAADRLQREEERLRIALEATGLILYGWHVATREVEVSEELCNLLGLPPTSRITLDDYVEYVHPDDRQRVLHSAQQLLRTGGATQLEYRLVRTDGGIRTVLSTASLQASDNGSPEQIIGSLHDITERRELEERLRQSQKMESIGTLAGGIAHDFNNLLTAIMGHGQFAMQSLSRQDDVRQEVEAMLIAADRARLLTSQLLAFSRRQILEARLLDVNDVVRDIARLLHRIIGEDIRLELVLASTELPVHADAGQLTQVLLNLATNARDAMPRGGRFRIGTSPVGVGAEWARRIDVDPGEYARIHVQDSGIGIDDETAARIFDPYFTTKPVGKGTGLGLATVYGIVRQSNGHVWVESEPGRGTSFHVLLPLVTRGS